jgi:glycosyltransferase involved in cell wall biosynthesis
MVIGVFGSIEPRKGQDLAILGLLELSDNERSGFELRLFGRTLDHVFANALVNISAGVDSVKFGGELLPESYIEEISKVDIVLVPSRDDTLPLVSLDALAKAKILIVSATTGTSEWLEDRESAMILRYNSPSEISETLRDLRSNPDRAEKIRIAGRKIFEREFSWEIFTARIKYLLNDDQLH